MKEAAAGLGPDSLFLNWSPDGTRLAFASNRNGWDEIFVMEVASGELVDLTPNADQDSFSPVWSPSGNYIAYLRGLASEVWVMNADGSYQVQVGQSKWRPVWLPQTTR